MVARVPLLAVALALCAAPSGAEGFFGAAMRHQLPHVLSGGLGPRASQIHEQNTKLPDDDLDLHDIWFFQGADSGSANHGGLLPFMQTACDNTDDVVLGSGGGSNGLDGSNWPDVGIRFEPCTTLLWTPPAALKARSLSGTQRIRKFVVEF